MKLQLAVVAAVASLLVVSGCTRKTAWTLPERCLDYPTEIAPTLATDCSGCHDASQADGGLRLDSYPALVEGGTSGAVAIAGDADSLMLTRAAGGDGHPQASGATQALLTHWIVDCNLSYFANDMVHSQGWVNPAASDFHGHAIEASGWDMGACAECHSGVDGTAAIEGAVSSCTTCHPSGATGCNVCHGSAMNDAPPRAVSGASDDPAIGAHQAHLQGSGLDHPIACEECHVVPSSFGDASHLDGDNVAEVTFGSLANAGGVTASYDPATGTCTSYCHGASLGDTAASNTAPTWNGGDAAAACGTCHGAPPADHTWPDQTCSDCHPDASPTGGFVDPMAHIDGTVQFSADACDLCHGAPPTANNHPQSTACGLCHGQVVSGSLDNITFVDPSLHRDGIVEVMSNHPTGWSDPSQHGLAFDAYGIEGCAVCHGANLDGGTSGVACASCHVAFTANWRTDCNFCHGDGTNALGAPPAGIAGETATTDTAVGAHRSHLGTSAWHADVVCTDCHVVPSDALDAGHIDGDGVAEVTFGTLANSDGVTSSWSGTTCATYCHGASLSAGSNTAPKWTTVDGTQAACGTCHGIPPGGAHPTSTNCNLCHADVIEADNTTFVNGGALHIDGIVEATHYHAAGWSDPTAHGAAFNASDVNAGGATACTTCHGPALDGGDVGVSCNSCHAAVSTHWKTDCTFCHGGTDNQTGAPPEAVDGTTATTDIRVGAHSMHVVDTARQVARDCTTCHTKPTDVFSAGHIDGTAGAEVLAAGMNSISPFAGSATFDGATGTCGNLYCHGNGRGNNGGNSTSLSWTGQTAMACNSCHPQEGSSQTDLDTMSGEHTTHVIRSSITCRDCHATVVDGTQAIIDITLHVDGQREVSFYNRPNASYNPATGRCTNVCHPDRNW